MLSWIFRIIRRERHKCIINYRYTVVGWRTVHCSKRDHREVINSLWRDGLLPGENIGFLFLYSFQSEVLKR